MPLRKTESNEAITISIGSRDISAIAVRPVRRNRQRHRLLGQNGNGNGARFYAEALLAVLVAHDVSSGGKYVGTADYFVLVLGLKKVVQVAQSLRKRGIRVIPGARKNTAQKRIFVGFIFGEPVTVYD
jgi:hypothetical protein